MADSGGNVRAQDLLDFCVRVFRTLGVTPEDAFVTADNLVTANLRGIDSHGVARLIRYVKGLQDGVMVARPVETIVTETPTTITIDAGAGLGQPVSHRAMTKAIEKARSMAVALPRCATATTMGLPGTMP